MVSCAAGQPFFSSSTSFFGSFACPFGWAARRSNKGVPRPHRRHRRASENGNLLRAVSKSTRNLHAAVRNPKRAPVNRERRRFFLRRSGDAKARVTVGEGSDREFLLRE